MSEPEKPTKAKSKRKRGRPRKLGRKDKCALMYRVTTAFQERLQAYCDAQEVPPSKTAVARVALEEFLSKRGC